MSGLFDQVVNYSPPLLTSGQVNYDGTWNAATNTPTLVSPPDALSKGDYYVVSAAGTQFGISFAVGDWIISNGTAWEKVDLTDAVSSVFGRTGAVVGDSTDYSAVGLTNTAIGAANPSTGAFTSLSSSSTTTLNGTTIPASKTLVVTTDKLSALAATTSAELAGVISDETGSGSLVFANSPTLVSPALGTPSALVGTNITGTAAAFNINGTVGATTPSTVAATAVTALSNSGYQAVVGQLTSGDRVGISGQSSGSGTALVFFDNAQTTFRPAIFDASSHSLKISGVEKASVTSTGLQGAIGATTPSTGAFTSLSSTSGAFNGTVGATTPSTVAATTATTTGNVGIRMVPDADASLVIASSSTLAAGRGSLRISGSNNTERIELQSTIAAGMSGVVFSGTVASPTATTSGQALLFLGGGGYDNTPSLALNKGTVSINATENWTTTAQGTNITFNVTPNGSTTRSTVGTFTSTGLNSTAIGATTPSTVAATTMTTTGNVTIGTTGATNFIFGDFSSALPNRLAFKTTTTNGGTFLGVIPDGSSTLGGINIFGLSDVTTNTFRLGLTADSSSAARINALATGTATVRNLQLQVQSTTIGEFSATGLAVTGALSATGLVTGSAATNSIAESLRFTNANNVADNGNYISWRLAGFSVDGAYIRGRRVGAGVTTAVEIGTSTDFSTTGATTIATISSTGLAVTGTLTTSSTTLHTSSVSLTNGAAAAAGTLTNAPVAGNPTKWIPIVDNGTTRYIPCW